MVRKRRVEFSIVQNLEEFGLSVEAAIDCWAARTDTFTAQDLCEYIKSKDPGIKCWTQEEFEEICKENGVTLESIGFITT
jgi:uncharacterized protein CbrC (UPF0167 family)